MRTFANGTSNLVAGILIAAVLGTLVWAGFVRYGESRGASRARILKLGHGLPTEHPVHSAMQFMAERVRELSHGKLEIAIYPSGMVGSEAECLKQVQNGQLDLAKTSTAVLESSVPEMTALSIPYVFRDGDHFYRTLNGPVGRELAEMPKGMRGLVYFDSGERSFYTTRYPVRTPDDLKGLKIRTQQSRSAMDMVSRLGGAPTPIPWGELYTALSQGTVDGAENNLPSFDTGRHLEVCKYFIESGHVRVPDLLVIGSAVWNRLSPKEQGWISEAAREAGLRQRTLWAEAEKVSRAKAVQADVQFIPVDRSRFARQLEPMQDDQPEAVRRLIRRIKEVK